MRTLLVAAIGLTLSGCGNLANVRSYSTPYAEPTSGDTARMRVITNGMARGVPARGCVDWNSPGAGVMAVAQSGFASRNGQNLGMPVSQTQVQAADLVRTELKVPANQPFTVNFQSQGSVSNGYSYSCQHSLRFTPQAGMDYELIMLESGQCLMSLQRLDTTGNPSPVALEPARLCNASDAL